MANNFVSNANITEILSQFNTAGVKVKVRSGNEAIPEVSKYGAYFDADSYKIYCRITNPTTSALEWKEMPVGGLGDVKTGRVFQVERPQEPGVFDNYLHLGYYDEGHELELEHWHDSANFTPFIIPAGGGGGGGTSTLTFQNQTPSAEAPQTYIETAVGADLNIKFNWTSVYKTGGGTTGPGTVVLYRDNVQIYNNPQQPQGDFVLNIKEFVRNGTQSIKVVITDSESTSRTFTWTVVAEIVSLTWVNKPSDGIAYYNGTTLLAQFATSGSKSKTVYFTLKNAADETVFSKTVTDAGASVVIDCPAQEHGVFTAEAYMTMATVGGQIETEHITSKAIWAKVGMGVLIAFAIGSSTIKQYATTNLKWMAIDPDHDTCEIQRFYGNTVLPTVTVDKQVQTFAYKASEQGAFNILLKNGEVEAIHSLTVSDSGIKRREVTDSLIMDVNPEGHSNDETNIRTTFGYTDRTTDTNHPFRWEQSTNFDWVNGGFQRDENGNTAFVIKRGTSIAFDRSLFLSIDNTNGETQYPGNGKFIEMIFKTANTETWEADLASCFANNLGIQFKAHQAIFKAGNQIVANYAENQITELGLNIARNSLVESASAMKFWLAGTPAGANTYNGGQGGTSFAQTTPVDFVIGSNECDIWLYRFKMYRRSLTDSEVLDNFVADCIDPDEKVLRDVRNDIFSDGKIDKEKLMAASPSLHILTIKASAFPPTKGGSGKTNCEIQHQIGNDVKADQWFAIKKENPKAGKDGYPKYTLQGTSSMNYRAAAGNLDIDLKQDCDWYYLDEGGQKVAIKKWKLFEDAVPEAYFNIKANVASSENANNMCLAYLYNQYDPYKTRQKKQTEGRTEQGECRDTMRGWPCAVFLQNTGSTTLKLGVDGARDVLPGEEILYFAGDLLNSKKNTDTCGQDDLDNGQYCMEFAENNNKKCVFQETSDFLDENWEFDENDFTETKERYGNIQNPSKMTIRNEEVYTITGEEGTTPVSAKVKYLIRINPGTEKHPKENEIIGRVPNPPSSSTLYYTEKHNISDITINSPEGASLNKYVSSTGELDINTQACTAGTEIVVSYQYKDDVPEIQLTNATLLTADAAGYITFTPTGTAGQKVIADYAFDRLDQFAPRYPEYEWLLGYYLVEGGIRREDLLIDDTGDEERIAYDFYTNAKARFVKMHNFVASCTPLPYSKSIPCGYTDSLLPESEWITDAGVTLDHDTLYYRQKRFINGVQREGYVENIGTYFDLDQICFHYVFTEFFTMVDNRGKNMFCSWEESNWDSSKDITKPSTFLHTVGETKQQRRYIPTPDVNIYPSTIVLKVTGTDVTENVLKVYTEGHLYIDETTLNTGDEIYIEYKYRNGTTWKYNFSKDYDNDKVDVVVKPYLIYGETQEIDNAEEDC